MTTSSDRRADLTRQHILNAAAHQFAHRPYSQVSLDDILAEAQVTKGAMYFHFRSKYALATAIIEEQNENGRRAINEVLARRLSAMETVVDLSFLVAVRDISEEMSRAGLNLLEEIGRAGGLKAKVVDQWVGGLAQVMQRAIAEGDVMEHIDPQVAGRMLVSVYLGLRQTSDLSNPPEFFANLEQTLLVLLPCLVVDEHVDYLTQFTKRRTALASATPALAGLEAP